MGPKGIPEEALAMGWAPGRSLSTKFCRSTLKKIDFLCAIKPEVGAFTMGAANGADSVSPNHTLERDA
jgi:hypothetical protein